MAVRVRRWLECDFPGCVVAFSPEVYAALVRRGDRHGVRDIRAAAKAMGWDVTDDGNDLCKQHADLHRRRPEQPPLFPVPGDDHRV